MNDSIGVSDALSLSSRCTERSDGGVEEWLSSSRVYITGVPSGGEFAKILRSVGVVERGTVVDDSSRSGYPIGETARKRTRKKNRNKGNLPTRAEPVCLLPSPSSWFGLCRTLTMRNIRGKRSSGWEDLLGKGKGSLVLWGKRHASETNAKQGASVDSGPRSRVSENSKENATGNPSQVSCKDNHRHPWPDVWVDAAMGSVFEAEEEGRRECFDTGLRRLCHQHEQTAL
jgi:hypothetical protein